VSFLKKILALNHTAEQADVDDPNTTLIHREIILSKPFLKRIYVDWYKGQFELLKDIPEGKIVEIGSGGGFIKDIYPQVITSDIMPLSVCDMTFAGEEMPFEKESLAAIIMVNVFHHIPNCELFLNEAKRVVKKGGKIVMVEPYNCAWSRFIYGRFHHEPFDVTADWKFISHGPLSSSNQALPYIVFERDRKRFDSIYPEFQIRSIRCHSPISYLLSGGVSMKCLVPNWSYSALSAFEKVFSSRRFNMFATLEIQKVS
jgi:SAM-dependent methyltransferase